MKKKVVTKTKKTPKEQVKAVLATFAYVDSLPIPASAKPIDVVAVTRPQPR
jgi:hypothetical protein